MLPPVVVLWSVPTPVSWSAVLYGPLLTVMQLFHRWVGNWPLSLLMLAFAVEIVVLLSLASSFSYAPDSLSRCLRACRCR